MAIAGLNFFFRPGKLPVAHFARGLRMAAWVKAGERSVASGPGSSGESPAAARSTDNGVVAGAASGALGWAT